MPVRQTATATLMSACGPHALDQAFAAGNAAVLVHIFVGAVIRRGNAKGFHMAAGETDSQKRLGWMDGLGEEVRVEREGAEVFKHGELGPIEIIGRHPSF